MQTWLRFVSSRKLAHIRIEQDLDQSKEKSARTNSITRKLRKCFAASKDTSVSENLPRPFAPLSGPSKVESTNSTRHEDPQTARIREWVLDSARYSTPPHTPHRDGSHKDENTSETERSKATTSSFPGLPGKEIAEESVLRPKIAKDITTATSIVRPVKTKNSGENVQFSRRSRTPNPVSNAAVSATRPETEQPLQPEPSPEQECNYPAVMSNAVKPDNFGEVLKTEKELGSGSVGDGVRFGISWAAPIGSLFAPILCTQNRRVPRD
jgi:hypothetical protein